MVVGSGSLAAAAMQPVCRRRCTASSSSRRPQERRQSHPPVGGGLTWRPARPAAGRAARARAAPLPVAPHGRPTALLAPHAPGRTGASPWRGGRTGAATLCELRAEQLGAWGEGLGRRWWGAGCGAQKRVDWLDGYDRAQKKSAGPPRWHLGASWRPWRDLNETIYTHFNHVFIARCKGSACDDKAEQVGVLLAARAQSSRVCL